MAEYKFAFCGQNSTNRKQIHETKTKVCNSWKQFANRGKKFANCGKGFKLKAKEV